MNISLSNGPCAIDTLAGPPATGQALIDAIVGSLVNSGWTNPTGAAGTSPRHVLCAPTPQGNVAGLVLTAGSGGNAAKVYFQIRNQTGSVAAPLDTTDSYLAAGASNPWSLIRGPHTFMLFTPGNAAHPNGTLFFACLQLVTGAPVAAIAADAGFLRGAQLCANASGASCTSVFCGPAVRSQSSASWGTTSGGNLGVVVQLSTARNGGWNTDCLLAYGDGSYPVYPVWLSWGLTANADAGMVRGEAYDVMLVNRNAPLDSQFDFTGKTWQVVTNTAPTIAMRVS